MSPELITVLVGLVIFVLAVLVMLVFLDMRNRRQADLVVRRSFERVAGPSGSANIDIPKEADIAAEPAQDKNRLRFLLFGSFAAGIFGILLAKLWSLQLLSGDTYQKMAELNRRSTVKIPAVRGRLLDRRGRELVGNRKTLIVSAPKATADDRNLVHRLSLVLGIPDGVLRAKLLDDKVMATADRVLASDVSLRAAAYIQTHPLLFAGVNVEAASARYYPFKSVAAHLLGYIGPVTEAELKDRPEGSELDGGDFVGKTGAELAYQDYLVGKKGERVYQVDAFGVPIRLLEETPAINGLDVCLTVDLDLQRACDSILAKIISSARNELGKKDCKAGALVAMDIADGGILAMSSYPTYNPESFTQGISMDQWEWLTDKEAGEPLLNRVTSGSYPAASTFKAFTSLAGLHHGLIHEHSTAYCSGVFEEYGKDWAQYCWDHDGHGWLDFEEAVNQSCDVFFYELAANFYSRWEQQPGTQVERPNELQEVLRSWGFGSPTGLDHNIGEARGRVPDAAWKREAFWATPEEFGWKPGDMTNLIIGQGDLLVTPLQLCNGYAGIARRKMLKPHVFHRVLDDHGNTLVNYRIRESDVQPAIEPEHIARLEEGLKRVVERNGGPFFKLPVSVRAKTGTGEIVNRETYSWFVAYAPAEEPKYCVACLVEEAGTGDSVAMQAVQHTLAAIYNVDIGEVHAGKGTRER